MSNSSQLRNTLNTLRFTSNRYSNDNYGGDYSNSKNQNQNQTQNQNQDQNNASRWYENPERFLEQMLPSYQKEAQQSSRQANQDLRDLANQLRTDQIYAESQAGANRNALLRDKLQIERQASGSQGNQSSGGGGVPSSAGGGGYAYGGYNNPANSTFGGAREIIGGGVRQVIRDNGVISQQLMYDPETRNREYEKNLISIRSANERQQANLNAYNDRLLSDQQASQTLRQQEAQQAAQERIARINQQTSMFTMGVGESGWRWF